MKEKKNLFIINSPLQVLNTLEAIYKFELKNIIIVAIYNRSVKNIEQIETQLSKINCEEIIRFNPLKEGKIKGYVRLIKRLQKNIYEKIFTGEIEDYRFKAILANLEKEQLFVLDEGSATVSLYESTIKQNKINKFNLKSFKFLLYGLKINIKDIINFFSYYDFEPLKNGIVVNNSLEYLKKDFKKNEINYDNTIFFLGQPLFIFSNEKQFEDSLNKVVKSNKDKKIIYIPHREDKESLKIVKKIDKNIEILELDKPIERYFLENGIEPKNIISFSSTALTTTKILFKNCNVEYIKNRKPNLKLNDMKNLDFIYKYFEKSNIKEFKE
ncbi:polysialyltransferase family glycosyltransferase [Aliarcobacter butzleri]|uniref:Uncharacterized protein n=1 Tax=Aliarcobacter butzleri L352 TaxID=1447260 RepID=A0A837JDY2_9BACT|nr:polysialyltransferase family glycosyltransferase [Aliarcobacter butzleri]KLE07044.1 hypothetical protein AF77_00095 [Aliarcobacter butzleri L352]